MDFPLQAAGHPNASCSEPPALRSGLAWGPDRTPLSVSAELLRGSHMVSKDSAAGTVTAPAAPAAPAAEYWPIPAPEVPPPDVRRLRAAFTAGAFKPGS